MSGVRSFRRRMARHAVSTRKDTLDHIEAAAPDFGTGEKTAVYSVRCCWWSSNPRHTGRTEFGLPCCPYCRSVLMQAPLDMFIVNARQDPSHFGPRGLAAFADAHDAPCRATWEEYR